MPWYVAYGQVIAWVLVVLLALLPIGLIRLKRALGDRSRANSERFPFGVGAGPAEGRITLRGVLRGGSARTVVEKDRPQHTRDERVWIEHEGERIELVGEVRVVRGTHARASWRSRTHEVRDGDVVIVKGKASRSSSSYREQGWTLESDAPNWPIDLCADKPASRGKPLSPPWLAGIFVVFGVGAYFGLNAFGKHQLSKFPLREEPSERSPMTWTNPAALATMMPGTHERGLAYLWLLYGRMFERSQANLDARVEISQKLRAGILSVLSPESFTGNADRTACEGAAFELADQLRFEEALARKCNSERVEPAVLLTLGRYSDIPAQRPEWMGALADIALGRWAAAAAHYDAQGGDCAGRLLEALGGDPDAREKLRQLAESDMGCAINYAYIAAPDQRAELLASIRLDELDALSRDEDAQTVADLRWAYDPTYVEEGDPRLVATLVAFARGSYDEGGRDREVTKRSILRRMWLSAEAPDSAYDVHAYRALFALERGDFAGARAELARSEPADVVDPQAPLPTLAQVIALREGTGPKPANGEPDGRVVARALARRLEGRPGDLLDEVAAVTTHREVLQAAVRVFVADARLVPVEYLKTFIHEAALIRDLHRIAGDSEQATRWQGIIDRHFAAFADPNRRRAIAYIGN